MTNSVTRIFNLSRNVVRVQVADGYEAAIWVGPTGADVFVSALDGTESYRVKLDGPKPGQKIQVVGNDDGSYDVSYHQGVSDV